MRKEQLTTIISTSLLQLIQGNVRSPIQEAVISPNYEDFNKILLKFPMYILITQARTRGRVDKTWPDTDAYL